jgi:xeroderma pigmentosum group C-complementing protein
VLFLSHSFSSFPTLAPSFPLSVIAPLKSDFRFFFKFLEKSEEADQALAPKSREKLKGKLKVGLDHDISVKAFDSIDDANKSTPEEEEGEGKHEAVAQTEMDWVDGDIPAMEGFAHDLGKEVTVEFTDSPSSAEKKTSRRLSPEEKVGSFNYCNVIQNYVFLSSLIFLFNFFLSFQELAELVQKVHLLCLLARGRMVDKACNDPLVQVNHEAKI